MGISDKDVLRILAGKHSGSNPGDQAVIDEWLENNQPKGEPELNPDDPPLKQPAKADPKK